VAKIKDNKSYMERILIDSLREHIGGEVVINGWVDVARFQGKMAFFDFRDRSGKVQGVVFGKPEVLEIAKDLKSEYVVVVTGKVNARPEKMINANVQNGDIEMEITGIEIISPAEAMPFDLGGDLNLDTLLDNRPLILRRERERAIFKIQHEILVAYRQFLTDNGFTEFQAPKLCAGTLEGSRSYIVPFRLNPGIFYSLAQSPQLYKQLLMVGVFERCFRFGRFVRDEATLGDCE
jgi:aspartyl-tRNA synthetase